MKKDLKSMVKMPAKKMEEKEVDQDMSMLGEDLDMLAAEESEEMPLEGAADMEMISDEDLLAEIKKRGLSMEDMPAEESEEIEEEETDMDLEDMSEDEMA